MSNIKCRVCSSFLLNNKKTALKEKFYAFEQKINKFTQKLRREINQPFYVFGGHAFTITFIRYLSSKKIEDIKFVLDNEKTKTDRRLSGTNLVVKSPDIISEDENPIVIIYMGAYTEEIIKQLKLINTSVLIYNLMDMKNEAN